MWLYDSENQIIQIPIARKISHQYNAHFVYQTTDGRCLKRFRVHTGEEPDLLFQQKIQYLQLKNFFQIDEYFFNASHAFRAFIGPFYEQSQKDFLLETSDYLLDNFTNIFASFDKLSKERIETWDANLENTIFTDNEIIIIDSERYRESDREIQIIEHDNYLNACWILYSYLIYSAQIYPEFESTNFRDYFCNNQSKGHEICRTLSKHKYPIDYLRKVKKEIN